MDSDDIEALETLLKQADGLGHLYVKKRGKSLTIASGDPPHLHARLTSMGRDVWGLSLPRHTGRWERTPFVGTMEDVVGILISDFSFYLDDIG